MKLVIDNRTGYLNDYYFQTLCLLYFPGEKISRLSRAGRPSRPSSAFYRHAGRLLLHRAPARERQDCGRRVLVRRLPLRASARGGGSGADHRGPRVSGRGREAVRLPAAVGLHHRPAPAKRARYFLARGNSEDRVRALFADDYLVSPAKTELTMRTAARETALLADISPDCCGLYVSVPFCPTRCAYCSFVSYSNRKLFALIPDYLDKLLGDIRENGRFDFLARPAPVRRLHWRRHAPILDAAQTERLFFRALRLRRTLRRARIHL